MTLREGRSDLELLLQKMQLSKDFRVTRRHLQHLYARSRAVQIAEKYNKNNQVEPEWLQHLTREFPTRIYSGDDPEINWGSMELGKLTIPQVVGLQNDMGVFRVSSSSDRCEYYPIPVARFYGLVPETVKSNFNFYFRINTSLFFYPYTKEASLSIIADDPMQVPVLLTENVKNGNLEIGIKYIVSEGAITHNGTNYTVGKTFTAVGPTWTLAGKVKYLNKKRAMTIDDPYPCSLNMSQAIIFSILTKDFQIEAQVVADAKNDGADQAILNQIR